MGELKCIEKELRKRLDDPPGSLLNCCAGSLAGEPTSEGENGSRCVAASKLVTPWPHPIIEGVIRTGGESLPGKTLKDIE